RPGLDRKLGRCGPRPPGTATHSAQTAAAPPQDQPNPIPLVSSLAEIALRRAACGPNGPAFQRTSLRSPRRANQNLTTDANRTLTGPSRPASDKSTPGPPGSHGCP